MKKLIHFALGCALLSAHAAVAALAAAPAAGNGKGAGSFLPGGNSKEPTTINAAKLDYFDKEKKMIYSGGVDATNGESKMKCATLVIFLTRESETPGAKPAGGPASSNTSVDKAECKGPMTLVSKGDVGTGDNGIYDKPNNKFYINGNVALSQGPNVTTGDQLIYDLNTSQAVVSGNVKSLFVPGSSPDGGKPKPDKKPKVTGAK